MSLRITHAIPVYAPAWHFGGPVRSVSRLCEGLAAEGHQVKVITTNAGLRGLPHNQLGRPVLLNGVEVTYYPVDRPEGTIQSKALENALPQIFKKVDLIHLSAIWQPLGISIQRQAWKQKIPLIHSLRGALGPYSRRQKWWKKYPYYLLRERPWLQRTTALHVTTRQEERELDGLGLRSPRMLLPNPVDLAELKLNSKARVAFRTKYGISLETPLLLICGRQHHKKGLDLLPPILSELRNYSWQLLLVGQDDDGSGTALLQALTLSGLSNRVRSLGIQPSSELGSIYNASDLLLLPSRHENFGNVVIESLACGCAIAVSDKTGVAEDLQIGAPPGFGSVMPRESGIWKSWLASWLDDPQRAGPEVAAWAAQGYSIEAVTRRALEIYQSIIQTSGDLN
ncbi:glycosyltransferase [Synechococcus sp. MIT S9508]|uniref:glycosyltransferase n=1 Tax=Synechococcus sp. MIT S9508 TaxID=1801629 RepID=UPI0007BB0095|nr:glycosyltransferase [Synechococcus sp. MIT S9508]KZR90622.1 Mannosylfructose-phosphate synthase [Synechococcus sp. MIT S9508]